jgi:hypothetical protein
MGEFAADYADYADSDTITGSSLGDFHDVANGAGLRNGIAVFAHAVDMEMNSGAILVEPGLPCRRDRI